jgi:RimJ/RimL family protein N-acetyltransferase
MTTAATSTAAPNAAIAALLRDEVFRIETPRLWMRWPVAGDAEALQVTAGRKCIADKTSSWPHPLPAGFAAERIARIRATNPTGRGLSLVLTRKVNPARAIGLIGVLDIGDGALDLAYMLEFGSHGRGLMTEAVTAFAFNLFTYGQPSAVRASALAGNIPSQRVLLKCGFRQSDVHGVEGTAAYVLARADWRVHVARSRAAACRFPEREARVA